jgi:hypothetical protein
MNKFTGTLYILLAIANIYCIIRCLSNWNEIGLYVNLAAVVVNLFVARINFKR